MTHTAPDTSCYTQIARFLEKAAASAETLDWDSAAAAARQAAQSLEKNGLPPATESDRALITEALSHIEAINERAASLRQDLHTLLKAFGHPAV
ncbi:MAG: hypothetical protein LBG69_09390 [Zoogloeaceae bacterium]|nr:hypothetical protein [Zoogloeaceae bacterium]